MIDSRLIDVQCPRCSRLQSLQQSYMGITSYTQSASASCRSNAGMQHSGSPTRLLQLRPIRRTETSIARLQRVQNSLARVVLQQPRLSSSMPLLRSLHWLPVAKRIDYKLAAITYKVRSTSTPAYLHSLLSDRVISSTMSLRSSSRPMLNFDITRTAYGSRAFSVAAPAIWNKLPTDIQLASKRLKHICFATLLIPRPEAERLCVLGLYGAI